MSIFFNLSAFLRHLLTFWVFFAVLQSNLLASAEQTPKSSIESVSVLVVHSYHPTMPWSSDFIEGLETAFKTQQNNVKVFHEYMDVSRVPQNNHLYFADYLQQRYADTDLDYVILLSAPALRFAAEHPGLLNNASKVFIEYDKQQQPDGIFQDESGIHISVGNDYLTSLQTMLSISEPEHIYVVADDQTAGSHRVEGFRQAYKDSAATIPVSYLLNLGMSEYKQKLANLPAGSAIYYLLLFHDAESGKSLIPKKAIAELAEIANAPVFTYHEPLMGSGVVGGYNISSRALGELAARTINSVANGEQAVLQKGDGFVSSYDWGQLQRWGLDETILPASSLINFKAPSIWQAYKNIVISALLIMLILVAGIFVLKVQVRNRTKSLSEEVQRVSRLKDQQIQWNESLQEIVQLKTGQIEKEKQIAVQANQAKSEFIANISHELRTPLHAIKSFSNILTQRLEDTALLRFANNIKISADRLHRVIDDLLDLSKLESGRFEFNWQQGDIVEIVNYSILELAPLFDDKGMKVLFDSMEPLVIELDRDKVQQVMVNLLGNAVRYGVDGKKIDIEMESCEATYSGDSKAFVKISIRDYGQGIPADELEAVFDSFKQSSKTSTGAGGTGLGLPICRKIIEAHNGRIWAESNSVDVPEGTKMVFTLPLRQPSTVDDSGNDSRQQTLSELRDKSILLVDDNLLLRTVYGELLEPFCKKVVLMDTGNEVLRKLDSQHFDIVISDIFMPDMSGVELTGYIRGNGFAGAVIGLTASVESKDAEAMLAAGADRVLFKPLSPMLLNQAMAELSVAQH